MPPKRLPHDFSTLVQRIYVDGQDTSVGDENLHRVLPEELKRSNVNVLDMVGEGEYGQVGTLPQDLS